MLWTSTDAVLLWWVCFFPLLFFLLYTHFVFPSKFEFYLNLIVGFYFNQGFPCVLHSHGWAVLLWLPLTASSWGVHNPWHLPCLFWILELVSHCPSMVERKGGDFLQATVWACGSNSLSHSSFMNSLTSKFFTEPGSSAAPCPVDSWKLPLHSEGRGHDF